jgi:hypothetical protein
VPRLCRPQGRPLGLDLGLATISEDLAQKKKLFNALAKAWFPGGAEDPDLELVQVEIRDAEFWNVKESKTTQLLKMATAAVTGNKPEMGEHREMHKSGSEPVAHD